MAYDLSGEYGVYCMVWCWQGRDFGGLGELDNPALLKGATAIVMRHVDGSRKG